MAKQRVEYEFMGPFGAATMIIGLPAAVLGLYFFCNAESCSILFMPNVPPVTRFWSNTAFLVFVGWFALHVVIYLSPLGYKAEGMKLQNGQRLKYKMNAIHAFFFSHILFAGMYFVFKVPVTFVYDHYLALAVASIVFSTALSLFLYAKSFSKGALLSPGGNTGNVVYDFFLGRELNPRTGPFDWKVFCEMRPGLIGWVMINYCMMAKEFELRGTVSSSMILVCFFQFWYILDALWFEEAILTTMDVVHDGFGFMLAFGDLAWVPFTYSLQARYIVDHEVNLPLWLAVCIFGLNFLGYWIFRGSNSQKNNFRRDPTNPKVNHLKTLSTKRGTKLILSGWWGICRHPNYVGDLIMALSWSLPCGVSHFLPYFYVTYFTCLLIHRQLRDEQHCREKYGEDWIEYCKIVKWRLIPGVY